MARYRKATLVGSTERPLRGGPMLFPIAALVLLALGLFAAPAFGAQAVTFATGGEGAGQTNGADGVAVDQSSGDLYIADYNNHRIDKFDAEGGFLMAWGWGVADGHTQAPQTCGPEASPPTTKCFAGEGGYGASAPGAVTPVGVAVDQGTGDVYVASSSNSRIDKFASDGQFLLMFGKNVDKTPGTPHPNVCTAADVSAGDTCGAGASSSEPGGFSFPQSIDVDSVGHVWVGDSYGRLQEFDSGGTFASQIELPGAGATKALALDSAGNFYVKSANFVGIRKLEAGTGNLIETLDASGRPVAVTVDGSDNVYVGDQTYPYRFMVFNPAGELVSQFGAGEVLGASSFGGGSLGPEGNALAVRDSAGALYVVDSRTQEASAAQIFTIPEPGPLPRAGHAEDVLPTTATLTATLNPEGHETTYRFQYGTSESYGSSTPVQTLPVSGFQEEEVEAQIEHLLPETTYHFRLVATNHCNNAEPAEECTVAGEDATFTTPPAVKIDAQWASDVSATTALLHAELDPLGVAGSWWVEYGLSEGYGQSTSEKSLPATFGDVSVQAAIANLLPGTSYHYRFAARDEREGTVYTVHGADRTFTTQLASLGFGLADNRAWEMVSPPDKHGGEIAGPGPFVQAAEGGEGITYLSTGSIEADPEGNRSFERSSVLTWRGGAGEWSSKDITPPHTYPNTLSLLRNSEYKLFAPDLRKAVLQPLDSTSLSPEASGRTPYLRENTEPPVYTPLVTDKEPYANVPPGTEFSGEPLRIHPPVEFEGASPDLTHVVLRSEVGLLGVAPTPSLYEWSGGQLEPVSVLPESEGGAITGANYIGSGLGSERHAVSDDGSRVFWTRNNGTGLYLRDTVAEESARLDVPQPGATGVGSVSPLFQGASADGTVVFFTDTKQLTDGASPTGADLYRCEIPLGQSSAGCATLTDITAPAAGSEASAEVQGVAAGLADDGTRIYFVAKGVLDQAPNGENESATAGQPNLYLWNDDEGVGFIATLMSEDRLDWGGGDAEEQDLSATASPSGRYLAFMSERSLTGYDNHDAKSGEGVEEAFRYDAETNDLQCVSCNPSGARPASRLGGFSMIDEQSVWGGRSLAAVLPEATESEVSKPSFYRPRAVLDNGRVFFNAADSLVPSDSNGQWDVYQYEPQGLGDCSTSSGGAAIVRSAGGCVSLISSGTGEEEAAFMDASASGDNVFFATPAQLSVLDEDHEYDVYDARVDGVPATLQPRTECLGEACQPAPQPPNDPTPASAAFEGQGNLQPGARKRCAKGKKAVRRKGKARCVAKHKQKRSRSTASRRAGR